MYFFEPKVGGYLLPDVTYGLFSSREIDNTDNQLLKSQEIINPVDVSIHPYSSSTDCLKSYKNNTPRFVSDNVSWMLLLSGLMKCCIMPYRFKSSAFVYGSMMPKYLIFHGR